MQQAGSSGGAERLTKSSNLQWANAVTPDGGAVLFTENDPATNWDLWLLPLSPPSSPVSGNRGPTKQREPRLLIGTPSVERNGTVSHDGRWLAWESNVSGQFEIYVTSFPDVSDDRRVGVYRWRSAAALGTRWSRIVLPRTRRGADERPCGITRFRPGRGETGQTPRTRVCTRGSPVTWGATTTFRLTARVF